MFCALLNFLTGFKILWPMGLMLVGRFCVFVTAQALVSLANFLPKLRNRCWLCYLYVRPTLRKTISKRPPLCQISHRAFPAASVEFQVKKMLRKVFWDLEKMVIQFFSKYFFLIAKLIICAESPKFPNVTTAFDLASFWQHSMSRPVTSHAFCPLTWWPFVT